MVTFYARMVAAGRIALEQVPDYWRDAVAQAMGN